MKKTFLFVHGTGVREPAFSESFALVEKGITHKFGADAAQVIPCYWGEEVGSRLHEHGASIPNFDATKSVDSARLERDYTMDLWGALYKDSAAELALLALRSPRDIELAPGQEPLWAEIDARVRQLQPEGELAVLLASAKLESFFGEARETITGNASYQLALRGASEPLGEYGMAIARSLLAECLQRYWHKAAANEGSAPLMPLNAADRDRIVDLIADAIGGREKGVIDWVKQKAGHLLAGWTTGYTTANRGRLSELAAGGVMDVLRYQAFPAPFRKFFRDAVRKAVMDAQKQNNADSEIIIIGHSLGGIIAVEALIEMPGTEEAPLPRVSRVITVGTQSGVLFECGALGSMPFDPNTVPSKRLPASFPRWLNIYDDHDFLSYLVAPFFGTDLARDVKVDNRQPFPESHGAYWTNPQVWDVISTFLTEKSDR